MAETTGISWTDSTFNPWIGCTKVGPGCDNCYAEALMDKRWHRVQWGAGQQRERTSAANWKQPLAWERGWEDFQTLYGRRQRVFCASLADVFDNAVPAEWRADLFALIEATPHLDWLLLTKRIGNVAGMAPAGGLPANVWLGATVVNQEEFDRDAHKLLAVPASVRFLSIEPMLGQINGAPSIGAFDWVIVGGESGHGARTIQPDWVASMADQCAWYSVPFFFKQWGGKSATAGGCELAGAEVKAWPVAAWSRTQKLTCCRRQSGAVTG